METKHLPHPTPWRLDPDVYPGRNGLAYVRVLDADGSTLAEMYFDPLDPDDRAATLEAARVVGAGSDLLSALRRICERDGYTLEASQEAHAAIRKALGR